MNYQFSCFWAKKEEKKGLYYWLPLDQHLEDTRRLAGTLWERWLSPGQRGYLSSSMGLDDQGGKNVFQFLAAVHDIGKATPAFQVSEGYGQSVDLNICLLEKLERQGFAGITNLYLPSAKYTKHALAGQAILSWHGFNEDLASIVGAHHGKPIDNMKTCEEQKSYLRNYYQSEDSQNQIYQKWKGAQEAIIAWVLETCSFTSYKDLPKIPQTSQVILSGLVIMVDWIASNTDYFPLIRIDEEEVADKEQRFRQGWEAWEKSDLWQARPYGDPNDLYKERFKFQANNIQETFSRTIEKTEDPGIFILEAPMGKGKTEAALVGAEQLAYKKGKSGIFFGLPTQATSNGIFPRIEDWLRSLVEDYDERHGLRLVHGKAALNKQFQELAKNVNMDEGQEESIVVNEWFSGRKTSNLDDFVVGTVDHFLLLALKQKHLALRHLGFTKKVIVIDEVHAYDAYMNQYMQRALTWMGAYGLPVILLSATLAADTREDLVRAYLKGKGVKWRDVKKPESGLELDAYPLITYTDGSELKQENSFDKTASKRVSIERIKDEDVLDLIQESIQDGGIVGVIVNTVKRAQEIAEAASQLFGQDQVSLLHSNFIDTARASKEDQLIDMIGKGAKRPHRHIVVGTQVIEQSLDIDFDMMISDLAPIDLIIQRLGRLHRHDIDRPKNHQEARLYLLGTSPDLTFEEGSSYVYGDYLLARSQYFLQDEISLPDDISPLVQKVYGHHEVYLDDNMKASYEEAKLRHQARIENKENKARVFRIDNPQLKASRLKSSSLVGWLSGSNPNESEEYAYAQVRDINETIEVIALKKIGKGYGFFDSDIDISTSINDPDLARKVAQNTLRLPQALSQSYTIDKTIKGLEAYNKENLKNWQKNSWLRGTLGIIFDVDNSFELNGYLLKYDEKYGLFYERVG